ncbi:MAG: hypothetical protein LBD10_04170 [Desulfobulbus sp.]|uniref:hypothetical protein n=1 Tax=Desulfobulbus sp. TaxID=895 RepID=UPI0028452E64|nr:hypothetical protein [Desulfobulbus sp.]MDR2549387.1 hypothetical protein [Desulfobulbus sp.]
MLTDYGFSVLDVIDGSMDIEDVIIGNLDDHRSQQVTNQTTKQRLSVYIEAIQATAESARSLLLYK